MSNQWVKTIETLEKDLTEVYQKIIDNSQYTYSCPENEFDTEMCLFCESEINDHDNNCIVLKAQDWMEG